ncbi:hypothetical protein KJ855_03945 [Patescibacteria group bacterium]|nr:hypothetical protein [Patescibacteria group bacterium]
MIKREQIIDKLKEGFEGDDRVYALWLEGADTNERVDEYSDIDVWLDVEDEYVDEIFVKVREILHGMGELDFDIDMRHPLKPVITQKMFHFKDSSKYLLVDVCIQRHSREVKFNQDNPDENPVVLFDKSEVIKFKKFNQEEFDKLIKESVSRIKQILNQSVRVENKIRRGLFLESWGYYHKWVLKPLVELVRIKYCSHKKDYYFKHIHYDLPEEVVVRLEDLHRVNDCDEIEKKMTEALRWGEELIDIDNNL